jgi:hypothetical protein
MPEINAFYMCAREGDLLTAVFGRVECDGAVHVQCVRNQCFRQESTCGYRIFVRMVMFCS